MTTPVLIALALIVGFVVFDWRAFGCFFAALVSIAFVIWLAIAYFFAFLIALAVLFAVALMLAGLGRLYGDAP